MTQSNIVNLLNNAPTRLSPFGTHSGIDITIQNVNVSGYIYVGGENVSSSNYGYRIQPNQAISFELGGRDTLYAISSAPAMVAAVIIIALETGE